jgi:prenyltransferase beta subunit
VIEHVFVLTLFLCTPSPQDYLVDPVAIEVVSDESTQEASEFIEMTPELVESCRRGMDFLVSSQSDDGSFGLGRYRRNVGIASLCALSLMADGKMPGTDTYGRVIQKTLDFILSCSTETGLISADNTSHGPMYGHGFATLFLGEIYGMNGKDTRVRDTLVRAVQLIVNSQNEEGGWRYNPIPYDADVSVTICQVMALRAARNAGIKVPKETIDRAVRYVRDCQNADGGFRYMIQPGNSAWPRTAAGVATLFYAGIYEDDSIARGISYLENSVGPGSGRMSTISSHYLYGHYYACQVMFIAGGERWRKWWPAIRSGLISTQSEDGSWNLNTSVGPEYGTAMALIVLQMPKRYLPIFQK